MLKDLYWSPPILLYTHTHTHTHTNISWGLQSVVKIFPLHLVIISTQSDKQQACITNSLWYIIIKHKSKFLLELHSFISWVALFINCFFVVCFQRKILYWIIQIHSCFLYPWVLFIAKMKQGAASVLFLFNIFTDFIS